MSIADDEAALIAEVELLVERHQNRRRAEIIRSCARESYRRYRKARGLPCQPDEVPHPQPKTESHRPFCPFARILQPTLLTEDAAETDRPLYPRSLPEDDGTLPGGAA
jgi:hypothetical protein